MILVVFYDNDIGFSFSNFYLCESIECINYIYTDLQIFTNERILI